MSRKLNDAGDFITGIISSYSGDTLKHDIGNIGYVVGSGSGVDIKILNIPMVSLSRAGFILIKQDFNPSCVLDYMFTYFGVLVSYNERK